MAKNKEDMDVEIPAQSLGLLNNYAGAEISLNQKRGNYFGIGDDGERPKIWLSASSWTCIVPDNLSPTEVDQLGDAIQEGRIVVGKQWIPAIEKVRGTKERYADIVLKSRALNAEAKEPFLKLHRYKKDGNYTALEILTYCKTEEDKHRSRPEWMTFLQECIDAYDGPVQLVEDFPEDPENYEVTIDPVSMTVTNDSRGKDALNIPSAPQQQYEDPAKREEALNNFFEGDSV